MPNRPNILFLMSDEHRPDVTGYEGNAIIRTPVLDELARTGVVFRNAYTPSPACIPARQSMMSGQLPKTCKCEGWYDLAPNYMTFARRFAEHAYETACFGKLHHLGHDQMQGWTLRLAGDMMVGAGYFENRVKEAFEDLPAAFHKVKWSNAKEVLRAGIGTAPWQTIDNLALEAAKIFVKDWYFANPYYDRVQVGRPVMLKLSLIKPHYPYLTTEEKFTYYLNRVQPFRDQQLFDHPFLRQRAVNVGVDVTERDVRRTLAAYYGMIEHTDEQFGDIMSALRHVGENLDDWIIVYTSDHGEMLGEHGIWEKTKFFEASARVPLIIRWPKHFKPRVVEENVNLCDLFATLCDLAGLPMPSGGPGLDSRSMVPLMRGDTREWHARYHNETLSQYEAKNMMIKRDHLKYQWYGPDMPEVLFDLQRDPGETRNWIDAPEHAGAVGEFRQRLAELGHGPNAKKDYVNAGYCER